MKLYILVDQNGSTDFGGYYSGRSIKCYKSRAVAEREAKHYKDSFDLQQRAYSNETFDGAKELADALKATKVCIKEIEI